MRLSARLVVLMDTSDIEHLRMLAHERDWSTARMARYMLSNGIKAEVRKRERQRERVRVAALKAEGREAGIRSLREMGVPYADR